MLQVIINKAKKKINCILLDPFIPLSPFIWFVWFIWFVYIGKTSKTIRTQNSNFKSQNRFKVEGLRQE